MPRERSLADRVGSAFTSTIVSSAAHSLLSPATRALDQVANFGWSNVPPDIGSVFQLYYTGRINDADVYRLAGILGIHVDTGLADNDPDRLKRAWFRLLEISRPMIDVDTALDLFYRGKIDNADIRYRLGKTGLPATDVQLLIDNRPLPEIATAIDLRHRGLIRDDDVGAVIDRHGFGISPYREALLGIENSVGVERAVMAHYLGQVPPLTLDIELRQAGYSLAPQISFLRDAALPFTPQQAMQMHFRGYLTEEQTRQHLQATTTRASGQDVTFFRAMRPMPGPSDLVRFAVREVWDNQTVQRWGYDQEFPPEFQRYMEWQGMGWGGDDTDRPFPEQLGISWPQAHWRAHWQPLPVHQAHEAFHKFRPDRIWRYQNEVPGVQSFTLQDLNIALKVSDYPPGVRDWLAANAFIPLRLTDIRNSFFFGIITKEEATELFRDRGQTLVDAQTSARLLEKQLQEKIDRPINQLVIASAKQDYKNILTSYRTGLISRDRATERLVLLRVPREAVGLLLDNEDVARQFARFKLFLGKVKHGFMEGTYSGVQVRQYLALLGVVDERAAEYVQEWDLERTVSHKAATTAMILKYVREGLLSAADGRTRLANLGWINVDAALAIASAQVAFNNLQTRTLAAAERTRAAKAKALQKIQEDMKKERKRIAAEIRRETPISTLKSWYVNCRITKRYLIPRMEAMLYTADDIRRYINDWDAIRKEKDIDCSKEGGLAAGGDGTENGEGESQ